MGWFFQSSFAKYVHHFAVIIGLLGELFRPSHLQNFSEQVESQVQGNGWIVGALFFLRGIFLLLPFGASDLSLGELQLQGAVDCCGWGRAV